MEAAEQRGAGRLFKTEEIELLVEIFREMLLVELYDGHPVEMKVGISPKVEDPEVLLDLVNRYYVRIDGDKLSLLVKDRLVSEIEEGLARVLDEICGDGCQVSVYVSSERRDESGGEIFEEYIHLEFVRHGEGWKLENIDYYDLFSSDLANKYDSSEELLDAFLEIAKREASGEEKLAMVYLGISDDPGGRAYLRLQMDNVVEEMRRVMRSREEAERWLSLKSVTDRTKERLASLPECPPHLLELLAGDEDHWVRWNVAKNPNTPPDVLRRLAEDEVWIVRLAVAENPKTPPEALVRLASDPVEDVRMAALRNPNAPREAHARAMVE